MSEGGTISLAERVLSLGRSHGMAVDASAAKQLAVFAELFLRWNARINIGGARTPEVLVDEHLVDSVIAAGLTPDAARIIDVGSGGGLPAIPLALLRPTSSLELYEPVAKKAAFLRTAVHELALAGRVTVQNRRVGDRRSAARVPEGTDGWAPGEGFDLAMSRATFEPAAWLTLGLELVRPGGHVLVFERRGVAARQGAVACRVYGDRQLSTYLRPV